MPNTNGVRSAQVQYIQSSLRSLVALRIWYFYLLFYVLVYWYEYESTFCVRGIVVCMEYGCMDVWMYAIYGTSLV